MKRNKILYIIIAFFIAYAGYASFQAGKKTWDTKKAAEAKIVQAFPALCEAGKWSVISKVRPAGEEFAASVVLQKQGSGFSDTEGSIIFTAPEKDRLAYFENREIEVEGVRQGEKEVAVLRVRCAGPETEKETQAVRQKLMHYISSNIDSLSSVRNPNGAWKVLAFHFVNETDFYVEFAAEPRENKEETMFWLVRASKLERAKPVLEGLAYVRKTGEEKTLIKGEDIHGDAQVFSNYKYNDKQKKWIIQ